MAGESRSCYASTVRFPRCGRDHNSIEFRRHNSEGETPGPIPNPEAKPFSADGTALVTGWESRTPPDILRLCRAMSQKRKALGHRGPFVVSEPAASARGGTCHRPSAAPARMYGPPPAFTTAPYDLRARPT